MTMIDDRPVIDLDRPPSARRPSPEWFAAFIVEVERMIAERKGVDDIAARFGVNRCTLYRRLVRADRADLRTRLLTKADPGGTLVDVSALVEDVEWMIETGERPELIARRLGVSLRRLQTRLNELGLSDLRARMMQSGKRRY